MTTWYLDQENGNDANAGTSFAARKKTLQSIAAAGWAAGDDVRVMGSPLPNALGVDGTWTNGSNEITLSAAVTEDVDDCDSGWTGFANSTVSHSTTVRRQGSASVRAAIATAFTTGLVAVKNLGTTKDLSAYQQISFWYNANSSIPDGRFTLRLCSDTAGTTVVNSFTIPAHHGSTDWIKCVIDYGSALGSSIQSVSINAGTDPGSITIHIDNIFVSTAPGAADELTLHSLIAKNNSSPSEDEPHQNVRSASGTSIFIGGDADEDENTPRTANYYGSTETTPAYAYQPIVVGQLTYTTAPTGDTNASPITIEGGWNRTDMSTKVGRTVMRRGVRASSVVFVDNPHGIIFRSFVSCHVYGDPISSGYAGFTFNKISVPSFLLEDCHAIGCIIGFRASNTRFYRTKDVSAFGCMSTFYFSGLCGDDAPPIQIKFKKIWGQGDTVASNGSAAFNFTAANIDIGEQRILELDIEGEEIRGHYNAFGTQSSSTNEAGYVYINLRNPLVDNVVYGVYGTQAINFWKVNFIPTSGDFGSSTSGYGAIKSTIVGEFTTARKRLFMNGRSSITAVTDQRRTASDFSRKVSGAITRYSTDRYLICKVLCKANVQRTVKIWAYRTSSTPSGRLLVRGGLYDGIPNDVTATTSGSLSTWEQLIITFTPTEDCVVDVFVAHQCDSASSHDVWFDDLEVT